MNLLSTRRPFSSSLIEQIFSKKLADISQNRPSYKPPKLQNFINGKWSETLQYEPIPNPLSGQTMFESPNTAEFTSVIEQIKATPKSGLFNPLKRPEMYRKWGDVCRKTAYLLDQPEIESFMHDLTFLCIPKHPNEILTGEIKAVKTFLENLSGDGPRFAQRGIRVAGDHEGQETVGHRFPFGSTLIISPFNLPLKIAAFNLIGSLICGNFAVLKPDNRTGLIIEAFVRLLLHAGMPPESMVLLHNNKINSAKFSEASASLFRLTQFTGSSIVANKLSFLTHGKVRIEDSGFNWLIVDANISKLEPVIDQIDQDAFSMSGQKCSALRFVLFDERLDKKVFLTQLKKRVELRSFANQNIIPLLSVSNKQMKDKINQILSTIPTAVLITGGQSVSEPNSVPSVYGLFQPTVLFVPWQSLKSVEAQHVVFEETFGPLLVCCSYSRDELHDVLKMLDKVEHHLSAGVVSRDPVFVNLILGQSVNGITYVGKGRTTGAPPNHFFGPSNDPRASGVGTPKCIVDTWTCHREIVIDYGGLSEAPVLPIS